MLNALLSFFNPYNRKARLQPTLLSFLPVFVVPLFMLPQLETIRAVISGLVIYSGGITLLTQIGRDRGKRLEPKLFQSWGGKPSTTMLRHRDTRLASLEKERYRAFLARAVPGLKLASPDDEQLFPTQADEGYEAAISWLLAQTREHGRFGLLFQENIDYGFRRNIWAFKPWALAADVAIGVFVVAIESKFWTEEIVAKLPSISTPTWLCLGFTVVHMLFFIFKIRPDWVRIPAEEYVRQLLAACDILENEQQ